MTTSFHAADGQHIHLHNWPTTEPKGLVLIVHGMCEHGARYAPLATFLNTRGYGVWSYDQRGHGLTASAPHTPVHLEPTQGRRLLVEDVRQISKQLRKAHPDKPLFLLGHSFGSLLACNAVQDYPDMADGLILSAFPEFNPLLTAAGQALASAQAAFTSDSSVASLHRKLSFGTFNKAFGPSRTPFDWISSDPAQVDKYVADPYCGQVATVGFYKVLMEVLARAHDADHWKLVPIPLPVVAVAGAQDSAAGKQKGYLKSMNKLSSILPQLQFRMYPNVRHEVLFDLCNEEVWDWIAGNLDDWTA